MSKHEIKVLVVEDKALIAEDIASLLKRHGFLVTALCPSAEEAIESVHTDPPDLVLMDIRLAGKMDGVTAASVIKKMIDLPLIYLSDYTDQDTVDRAKKTLPENYLTKPFQEADLVRAIDLAFYNFNNRPREKKDSSDTVVFVRTDSQSYMKLPLHDILYLEAERAYCKIVCREKTYTLSTSMNHIHEQLPGNDFVKVHRSYVINVKNITGFDGNMVRIGKAEITMNREAKEELTAVLKFIR